MISRLSLSLCCFVFCVPWKALALDLTAQVATPMTLLFVRDRDEPTKTLLSPYGVSLELGWSASRRFIIGVRQEFTFAGDSLVTSSSGVFTRYALFGGTNDSSSVRGHTWSVVSPHTSQLLLGMESTKVDLREFDTTRDIKIVAGRRPLTENDLLTLRIGGNYLYQAAATRDFKYGFEASTVFAFTQSEENLDIGTASAALLVMYQFP